jgi:biopolymer transport protein ExbD
MPLKIDSIDEPDLNLTPMIDIVFLLLIFFMVGAKFTEMEQEFDVQLPTVSNVAPLTDRPDEIVVNVHRNGTIVVDGRDRTIQQLEVDLRAAKANYVDQAVVVRGDGGGLYQPVVDVLAVCNRADIAFVSLAHRLQEGGEQP